MEWKFEPDWNSLAALEQIARAEVARAPRSAGTWHSLIDLQVKLGRIAEIAQSLEDASAALGPDVQGRMAFIALALGVKRPERAVAEAEALIAAHPDDEEASALLQRALVAANMMDPARHAGFAKPGELTLALAWKFAKTPADFSKLIARCRAVLADNPIETDARWVLAHALAQCGEDAAAREVMGLAKFFKLGELPLPEGYDAHERFRTALRQEILRNPTLETDPKRRATRNGQQTGKIGLRNEPALVALAGAIKAAVARYREELGGDVDPFVAMAPDAVGIDYWAVVYGADGHQISHRHSTGWVSGVYYVSAPCAVDAPRRLGSLLVGAPDESLSRPAPWGVTAVEPVPGRLVLFPSFVPHATEPCGFDQERISVAFDIIPVGPASVTR